MGEEGEQKKQLWERKERKEKRETNNYYWFRPFWGLGKPEMSSKVNIIFKKLLNMEYIF